jgi:hypothetical protein
MLITPFVSLLLALSAQIIAILVLAILFSAVF